MTERKGIHPLKPQTCRTLDGETQGPSVQGMSYVECAACGGRVEIWDGEKTGICLDCGAEWRPTSGIETTLSNRKLFVQNVHR